MKNNKDILYGEFSECLPNLIKIDGRKISIDFNIFTKKCFFNIKHKTFFLLKKNEQFNTKQLINTTRQMKCQICENELIKVKWENYIPTLELPKDKLKIVFSDTDINKSYDTIACIKCGIFILVNKEIDVLKINENPKVYFKDKSEKEAAYINQLRNCIVISITFGSIIMGIVGFQKEKLVGLFGGLIGGFMIGLFLGAVFWLFIQIFKKIKSP